MYQSEITIRVRYGETDQMGYVYYGNYALYYEVGRTEAIRQLGFSYKELEELGIHMPVMQLNCHYLRAAKYDDLIRVVTIVKEMPIHNIVFHTEIYNEKGKLLNKGFADLIFFDPIAKKKTTVHPILKEKLEVFF